MTERNCPKCPETMNPHGDGNESAFTCTGCAGTWIELAGHEAEIGELPAFWAALKKAHDTTELHCPNCADESLKEVEFASHHLDACTGCHGIYFDAGELAAIREVLKKDGGKSLIDHGTEVVKFAGQVVVEEIVLGGICWAISIAGELVD